MIRRRIFLCLLLWVGLSSAGCSRQVVDTDNPVTVSAEQYRRYFDSSIDVLRDAGYVIDRRDYRFGTITTLPQSSPNIVELWNSQNTTADQAIQSTLSNEQRHVTVQFAKARADEAEASDDYLFEVNVMLERKQVPTRRMAGSARRNVFSDLSATPRGLHERGVTGVYWEPVGRDALLEARLMKQIRDRAAAD